MRFARPSRGVRTLFKLFERASDIRAAQREKMWRRAHEKGRRQALSKIRALLRDAARGRDPETGAPTIIISRELRAALLDESADGDA